MLSVCTIDIASTCVPLTCLLTSYALHKYIRYLSTHIQMTWNWIEFLSPERPAARRGEREVDVVSSIFTKGRSPSRKVESGRW